jgi:hypothetical protein
MFQARASVDWGPVVSTFAVGCRTRSGVLSLLPAACPSPEQLERLLRETLAKAEQAEVLGVATSRDLRRVSVTARFAGGRAGGVIEPAARAPVSASARPGQVMEHIRAAHLPGDVEAPAARRGARKPGLRVSPHALRAVSHRDHNRIAHWLGAEPPRRGPVPGRRNVIASAGMDFPHALERHTFLRPGTGALRQRNFQTRSGRRCLLLIPRSEWLPRRTQAQQLSGTCLATGSARRRRAESGGPPDSSFL